MDRHEVFEAGLDPVLGLDGVEGDALCDVVAGGEADQFADRGLIGCIVEMQADVPAPVRAFERRDGGLAFIETFVQQIDHPPRGSFVADGESRAAGGRGDRRGHR